MKYSGYAGEMLMNDSPHGTTPIYDEAFMLARQVFSTTPAGWADHDRCAACDEALIEHLARTIRAAVAAERLACAHIAESEPQIWEPGALDPRYRIGAKIRARGTAPAMELMFRQDIMFAIKERKREPDMCMSLR